MLYFQATCEIEDPSVAKANYIRANKFIKIVKPSIRRQRIIVTKNSRVIPTTPIPELQHNINQDQNNNNNNNNNPTKFTNLAEIQGWDKSQKINKIEVKVSCTIHSEKFYITPGK